MKNLLQDLHEQFCGELNALWLEATRDNDGCSLDHTKYQPLINRIVKARKDGYSFALEISPSQLLKRYANSRWLEQSVRDHPTWKEAALIQRMMDESTTNGWELAITGFTTLHDRLMHKIMSDCAITFVRNNGPFYTKSRTDIIYLHGETGSFTMDAMLVVLQCNPFANRKPADHLSGD